MQFLKTLFWVILAVVLVLCAKANWKTGTIHVWGGLQAVVKVPVITLCETLNRSITNSCASSSGST